MFILQWEALALLLIGISVNQLRSLPEGTTALGLHVTTGVYIYTLIFVSIFGYLRFIFSDVFFFLWAMQLVLTESSFLCL